MTEINLKEILFEELDYTEGSGLEDATSLRGRPIPYIDQVYFVQDRTPSRFVCKEEQETNKQREKASPS